jgi:hypothetical protein
VGKGKNLLSQTLKKAGGLGFLLSKHITKPSNEHGVTPRTQIHRKSPLTNPSVCGKTGFTQGTNTTQFFNRQYWKNWMSIHMQKSKVKCLFHTIYKN